MTFGTDTLMRRLEALQGGIVPARYLVAYSGGLDSAVLLHALQAGAERHGLPVVAVHVNHCLHADADEWERRCRRIARALGAGFEAKRVQIGRREARGIGIEAAARAARYAALRETMTPGDALLSAHHLEDQAETVLLNLMRGSGLSGLAAIGAALDFPPGRLLRPLLDVPRAELRAYAERHGLEWTDDPANLDTAFDRNFLRHEILPALKKRWPAAAARLKQSAELAAEARVLQEELAAIDYAAVGAGDSRLDIAALSSLPEARRRNLLRYAIRKTGLPAPPLTRLRQVLAELVPARADAAPLVRWPGAEVRRYRGRIYLLPGRDPSVPQEPLGFDERGELSLGPGLGRLVLEDGVAGGLDRRCVAAGLEVRFRRGGEMLRPAGGGATRPLKKLLQEKGVVPWMRDSIPLVYARGELVAVAHLWLAADAVAARGHRIAWEDHPALF